MDCISICNSIFDTIYHFFSSSLFQTAYRIGNSFTRTRKLDFFSLFLFLLRQYDKSCPINLLDFFEEFSSSRISSLSKQAISKARKGIHPQAFAELLSLSSSQFYLLSNNVRTWHGFHVLAVDGTTLQMPQTKQNLEVFGASSNQTDVRFAIASASLLYDTLNDILLDAKINSYSYGERLFAKEHLSAFSCLNLPLSPLFVFDRGYPCVELCRNLQKRGYSFVMRIKKNTPAIKKMKEKDGWISYGNPYPKGNQVRVRALRILLSSGEEEYLITNLSDPNITLESFRELYFLRWKVETKYWELKHRFQIERFSGMTPWTIQQDFYITLFLSNVVSIIKKDTDKIIEEKTQGRKNKEQSYQTNRGMLINRVKKYLLSFFTEIEKRESLWKKILDAGIKTRSQVRKNRSYERKAKHTRRKYHSNRKSC